MSIPRAQPHAQSLFLFPIVFGINLIHFLEEKKDGADGNSIVCFAASNPCHATWQCKFYEECELFRRVERFWQRKVWIQRQSRKEKRRCKFLARKSAKLFPILRCKFLARKNAKLIANFNATMVTSLPSISLSLSVSLSLSHRAYLTHNIGNASAFPIIIWWQTAPDTTEGHAFPLGNPHSNEIDLHLRN